MKETSSWKNIIQTQWDIFYKITDQHPSKASNHEKQVKAEEFSLIRGG